MWDTRIIADKKIQEAQEDGEFDNLPGAGKPLNLDDDLFVPPHLRAAHRILKNANVPPDWIQLDRDLSRSRADCEKLFADTKRMYQRNTNRSWLPRSRSAYLRALKQFNTDVLKFNMTAPAIGRVHLPFKLAEEMARFDAAFPCPISVVEESTESRTGVLRTAAEARYRNKRTSKES